MVDSSLLSQRFSMPALPTAIALGRSLLAWRVELPSSFWTPFYEAAAVSETISKASDWQRVIGVETRYNFGPVPVAFTPRVQARGGVGYTLSDPFRKRVRVFLEMRVEP